MPAQKSERQILDQKTWSEKADGIDYTEKQPEEEEIEEEAPQKQFDGIGSQFSEFPSWVKPVLFIVLIFLLLVIIGVIIMKARQPANVTVKRAEAKSVEEAEENLPDVELEMLYQKSLDDGSLKIALRIKFLMVLQALIDHEMVVWKKRKTNHAYELEIEAVTIRENFVEVVTIFERVWYGAKPIEQLEFDQVVSSMDGLKNSINGK